MAAAKFNFKKQYSEARAQRQGVPPRRCRPARHWCERLAAGRGSQAPASAAPAPGPTLAGERPPSEALPDQESQDYTDSQRGHHRRSRLDWDEAGLRLRHLDDTEWIRLESATASPAAPLVGVFPTGTAAERIADRGDRQDGSAPAVTGSPRPFVHPPDPPSRGRRPGVASTARSKLACPLFPSWNQGIPPHVGVSHTTPHSFC